jgi:hypothetical protein
MRKDLLRPKVNYRIGGPGGAVVHLLNIVDVLFQAYVLRDCIAGARKLAATSTWCKSPINSKGL